MNLQNGRLGIFWLALAGVILVVLLPWIAWPAQA